MRLLLDTQIFLWMVAGSHHMPAALRERVCAPDVSVWDAADRILRRYPIKTLWAGE